MFAGRQQHADEAFTLIELMVAMLIFITLSTAVMISTTNTLGIVNQTSATYTSVDQVLGLSSTLERLVSSEVEPNMPVPPNPPTTQYATPFPGFALNGTTTNSMTFYTDTGNPNGPAQVQAAESTTPNPCTGGGCPTYSFTVTETAPDPTSCPTSLNLANGKGAGCTYLIGPAKQVISINDVANTSAQPIFTYTILNNGAPQVITPTQLAASPSFFSSCTPSANLAQTCPSDAIQSVEFSFFIYAQGAPSTAEYDTTVYRLSSTSYEYSASVG